MPTTKTFPIMPVELRSVQLGTAICIAVPDVDNHCVIYEKWAYLNKDEPAVQAEAQWDEDFGFQNIKIGPSADKAVDQHWASRAFDEVEDALARSKRASSIRITVRDLKQKLQEKLEFVHRFSGDATKGMWNGGSPPKCDILLSTSVEIVSILATLQGISTTVAMKRQMVEK